MRLVSFAENDVPRHLRVQVRRLQQEAWPSDDEAGPDAWHDPGLHPVSILLLDGDERVVSTLDILSKPLDHRGETYAVSGISAMVTDPALRGRGHGRRLAAAAATVMAAGGSDLGIFTCDNELRPFYESAGWRILPGSVLIGGTPADPLPSDRFDKVTMARFFSTKAMTAGPSFVAARIELYPGDIDRLW